MATCGKCKAQGQTVAHIRACYAAPAGNVLTKEVFMPMALATPAVKVEIPSSKYALPKEDGKIIFYDVRKGTKKWAGFTFVDRLVGHPGDWMTYPVKGENKIHVLDQIAHDPKAAALLFSRTFVICAACGSPLSDPESLAAGFGPICQMKF